MLTEELDQPAFSVRLLALIQSESKRTVIRDIRYDLLNLLRFFQTVDIQITQLDKAAVGEKGHRVDRLSQLGSGELRPVKAPVVEAALPLRDAD